MDQPLTADEESCQEAGGELCLTQRQGEILALVAQGATDGEIAPVELHSELTYWSLARRTRTPRGVTTATAPAKAPRS